jgi:DNA-binding NarL/FixJ family response regulator
MEQRRTMSRQSVTALPSRVTASRRVLLVTDRSIHSAALQGILDGEPDFTVVGTAATYAVAVHRAQDLQPDLMIVDLAMHALNERLLLRALRMAAPTAALVVINGTGSPQDESEALDEGADLYCPAAIGVINLVAALRAVRPWGTPAPGA